MLSGKNVAGHRSDQMVKSGIVQVPQGREVFATMTVNENLELGAATRNDKADIRSDLDRMYELFPHLKERRARRAGSLSGGEQQQVAIGRALMAKPAMVASFSSSGRHFQHCTVMASNPWWSWAMVAI